MNGTIYSKDGEVLAYVERSKFTGLLTGVSIADGIVHCLEFDDTVYTIGTNLDDFDIAVDNPHVLAMNPVILALEMPKLPKRNGET